MSIYRNPEVSTRRAGHVFPSILWHPRACVLNAGTEPKNCDIRTEHRNCVCFVCLSGSRIASNYPVHRTTSRCYRIEARSCSIPTALRADVAKSPWDLSWSPLSDHFPQATPTMFLFALPPPPRPRPYISPPNPHTVASHRSHVACTMAFKPNPIKCARLLPCIPSTSHGSYAISSTPTKQFAIRYSWGHEGPGRFPLALVCILPNSDDGSRTHTLSARTQAFLFCASPS